jgi:hypothetical protein
MSYNFSWTNSTSYKTKKLKVPQYTFTGNSVKFKTVIDSGHIGWNNWHWRHAQMEILGGHPGVWCLMPVIPTASQLWLADSCVLPIKWQFQGASASEKMHVVTGKFPHLTQIYTSGWLDSYAIIRTILKMYYKFSHQVLSLQRLALPLLTRKLVPPTHTK